MKKLHFSKFTTIAGINGASGLDYADGQLILISDDSFVVYKYAIEKGKLEKFQVNNEMGLKEDIAKALKPDFESLAFYDGHYYLFCSGSTPNRNLLLKLNCQTLKVIEPLDLSNLYQSLRNHASISEEDFNIEGVILTDESALFFNRGNGPKQRNGIFKVVDWLSESVQIQFIEIPLPTIENTRFGFTDACLIDEFIYFTASAEGVQSTYEDGEILGSGIGILQRSDFKLVQFEIVSQNHKLEGISLHKKTGETLEFFLCEDADDELDETEIFQLKIKI